MPLMRELARASAVLFSLTSALRAQSVNPIPGYLQDVAAQYPFSKKFSFEQQIQAATQANSSGGNPFSYWHGVQIRPWFHYDGIQNTTLTGSVSYIDYFNVPGTSNYKHPEWRITAFGT